MAYFQPKYGNFWKSACISETTTRGAKISSISTPWGRKRLYVQLLAFWPKAKFHAQIWQFGKSACISETVAPRVQIAQCRPLGVEREDMWNFGKWPKFWSSWFSSRASRPMGLLLKFCRLSEKVIACVFPPDCVIKFGWIWMKTGGAVAFWKS